MTRKEKIESVIEDLTTAHLGYGGYPFDYRWFGEELAIARIDHDGASQIDVYTKAQLTKLAARFGS